MAKANLKVKEAQGRANLNVVTTNPIKTVAYNDINLKEWKNYPEVKTDTFWQFPTRLRTGGQSNDLSNCSSTEEFYDLFEKVAKNGYDLLEKGRFAALIIGDSYKNSQVQPLGFRCMERMQNLGFILKSIIVKDIQGNERAKGKTANLWRYRALAGGFSIFQHEYIFIFQKVK